MRWNSVCWLSKLVWFFIAYHCYLCSFFFDLSSYETLSQFKKIKRGWSSIRTSEKCEKKNNSKLNTIVLPFFFHYFHNNIDVFIFSLPKWHKIQLKLRYTSKNLQNIINFVYKLAQHIKFNCRVPLLESNSSFLCFVWFVSSFFISQMV